MKNKNKNLKNIVQPINSSQITLVVIPSKTYDADWREFVKKMEDEKNGYISVNNDYLSLTASLSKYKINSSKFFFIDCVGEKNGNKKKEEHFHQIAFPNELTKLNVEITKMIKTGFDNIIFDSLSASLSHYQPKEITNWVNGVWDKIRKETNINFILMIASKDRNSDLFNQIQLLVNQTIEL